jgi:hypothetical protein
MLVFTPIALCFVYTSWHFYVFSETNLLPRCHSASSCFLLFLCFRKVTQEIFSELDETKAKVPIYLTRRRSPKERQRAARMQPQHRVARATPSRATRWCGPLVHLLTSPFRLYILSEAKTLEESTYIHKKFCSAAAIEVSVSTPYRDGELPSEPSPSTPPPSSSSLLTPMMWRE